MLNVSRGGFLFQKTSKPGGRLWSAAACHRITGFAAVQSCAKAPQFKALCASHALGCDAGAWDTDHKAMKVRVSLVSYLNAAPLGWSLIHGPLSGRFEVLSSVPARCADQLANGEADIGLIPSIEYQRIPNLRIIPGIAIASTSTVRSILMVQPRNPREVRSVALDTTSRTSAALARILLEKRMGLHPEYVPHAPDLAAMLRRCDAALLIGDAALKVTPEEYRITDLAEAWIEWQRRPFVFAVWACRMDAGLPADIASVFQEAKEFGLKCRNEIAAVFARTLRLPEAFLYAYLVENINYDLSSLHIEGLEKFFSLASERDLITGLKPLRFLKADTSIETALP